MEVTIRLYRTLFSNRAYVRSVGEGFVFFAASAIAIFAAVSYATVHASNYVTDLVLSRVGPYNLRFLFVYGTFTAFVITGACWLGARTECPSRSRPWRCSYWSVPCS